MSRISSNSPSDSDDDFSDQPGVSVKRINMDKWKDDPFTKDESNLASLAHHLIDPVFGERMCQKNFEVSFVVYIINKSQRIVNLHKISSIGAVYTATSLQPNRGTYQ